MEGGSIIGTRNIQSHLSLQWKQKIGRRFLRIISFNPIEFSHAAEFRNTKVSEHKSITSAKVEEDDMSRPTTNKAISRYTDRTHQRPMLSKTLRCLMTIDTLCKCQNVVLSKISMFGFRWSLQCMMRGSSQSFLISDESGYACWL